MRKYLPEITVILLLAYLNFVIGCTYYKVTTAQTITNVADQIQNNAKYFIVHQGINAWHLKTIALNAGTEELSGIFEPVSESHQYYLTTNPSGANKYKASKGVWNPTTHQYTPGTGSPTDEVHIYISLYKEGQNAEVTIPFSSITKVEIYDKDTGANTTSAVFATLGIVAGVIVVIGVIAILTKSSCPFVYIHDGSSYHFAGEMYGGAIYSSLERNDFMPLPGIVPSNGDYKLKIANKLLERQYTNLAELMVVEHPDTAKVLIDKYGRFQSLLNPQAPSKVISDKNIDYRETVMCLDSTSYIFCDENTNNKDLSSLTLTFKKPVNCTSGKLVLNVRNSYWLDYVYGKFNEQFGTYYNAFSEKQKSVPAQKINQWVMEQNIPLSVYVGTEDGWEFVDYFQPMGPLASRDMVLAIDLSNVKEEEVQIRVECGFMFWEMNYAGMDFTEEIPVTVSHLSATSAIDEKGNDVSSLVVADDGAYLIQPEVGNEVTLTYSFLAPERGHLKTVFLHSKGYYEYIRDYKNTPDLLTLYSFKKKGAFTKFSKEQYTEFVTKPYFFDDAISTSYGN